MYHLNFLLFARALKSSRFTLQSLFHLHTVNQEGPESDDDEEEEEDNDVRSPLIL